MTVVTDTMTVLRLLTTEQQHIEIVAAKNVDKSDKVKDF